jgi:hypothetical protein
VVLWADVHKANRKIHNLLSQCLWCVKMNFLRCPSPVIYCSTMPSDCRWKTSGPCLAYA